MTGHDLHRPRQVGETNTCSYTENIMETYLLVHYLSVHYKQLFMTTLVFNVGELMKLKFACIAYFSTNSFVCWNYCDWNLQR